MSTLNNNFLAIVNIQWKNSQLAGHIYHDDELPPSFSFDAPISKKRLESTIFDAIMNLDVTSEEDNCRICCTVCIIKSGKLTYHYGENNSYFDELIIDIKAGSQRPIFKWTNNRLYTGI